MNVKVIFSRPDGTTTEKPTEDEIAGMMKKPGGKSMKFMASIITST